MDATPLVPDPLIGQVLGDRYRLLARIGEGGMGTVYRAEHVVLRKRMAVKVLRPELSADLDLVRRFQQEAIAASAIGQENIVDVTDFGRTAQGSLYFVMEELEGVGLSALLVGGPLPVERAVLILAQVCRALAAAHGRGIVHRDLKPDNVIVVRREDGSDFVKVVDFGISKNGTSPEGGRLTRAGTIIGTPEYMAPEQGAAATVDQRADIYAFGVLAYELLTGTLPFHGDSAVATLLQHQTRSPEPPGQRRPGLPAELEALVLKALEKRPQARQQSMAEVASELTRVLLGLGLPPVYEHAPAPPSTPPAPLAGFTERFPAGSPGASSALSRRSTGRGSTVALEEALAAGGEAARRRRAGRGATRAGGGAAHPGAAGRALRRRPRPGRRRRGAPRRRDPGRLRA
ncbi:MAG TPA: serine/threonine-protein kinase, partial [Anaeromyxobacteraceae bacterium]